MTDSEKIEALYRLYEKPLYRIALAVLHSHEQAEDAVHDAFCKVIRHIKKIGEPESPETKAYMIAVIRSVSFSQYRRNERQNAHFIPITEDTAQIADSEDALNSRLKRNALRELIERLMRSLTETDRSIVLLHCRDGLTFAEIGAQLSLSEAAARKRFERARKTMKQEKGALFDESETD